MGEMQEDIMKQMGSQPSPDAAKIMYDALVEIAHSDGFFASEKRLIRIARIAIEKVTDVKTTRVR